jgi:phospholipase C
MMVISPYAKRGYVDDARSDFSSPLRFISDNWGLPYNSTRIRDSHNYEHVFDFDLDPRPPEPRRKVAATSTFYDWPDDYDWLPGVVPEPPLIRYP